MMTSLLRNEKRLERINLKASVCMILFEILPEWPKLSKILNTYLLKFREIVIVTMFFLTGLKLILKVGGSSTTSTPEHSFDTANVLGCNLIEAHDDTLNSPSSSLQYDAYNKQHKKSKKKKKKREKDYDKRDKKKKHRKVNHPC